VQQDEADLNRMLETMDDDVADEARRSLQGIVDNGRQQGNAAKAAAMCIRTNE
jgi:phage-related minor tail protein